VRYTILDLGCGLGAASKGYADAGFDVVGLDIVEQPHYPYEFILGDMLSLLPAELGAYDAIHVSPPCQRWSKQLRCNEAARLAYPDLITPMRPRLKASGRPWVIENVEGAPLISPHMLCSWMFGYETYRHRLFEVGGFSITTPKHRPHFTRASKAGHWEEGTFISVAGHCAPMWKAREVMQIDWGTREELVEAIPPYFTQFIGSQLITSLMLAA
jgi:DNA (cytosine-5)-methyltransferase 1